MAILMAGRVITGPITNICVRIFGATRETVESRPTVWADRMAITLGATHPVTITMATGIKAAVVLGVIPAATRFRTAVQRCFCSVQPCLELELWFVVSKCDTILNILLQSKVPSVLVLWQKRRRWESCFTGQRRCQNFQRHHTRVFIGVPCLVPIISSVVNTLLA
jgi:hypothetical protein